MGQVGALKKKFVLLQDRDLSVFRWVAEQKFATRGQIARQFFPNERADAARPDRVCYRRLLLLCKFGFLETRHVRTDAEQFYQVGKAGLSELAHRGEDPLPYIGSIDLKNFEHDQRVTDVRIELAELGAKDWKSERRIKAEKTRGRWPDALFTLGENRCALEMELSLKRLERYPMIFRSYVDHHSHLDAVFFVCGTQGVRDTLLRLAGDSRRFYFGLWEDARAGFGRAVFANRYDRVTPAELV